MPRGKIPSATSQLVRVPGSGYAAASGPPGPRLSQRCERPRSRTRAAPRLEAPSTRRLALPASCPKDPAPSNSMIDPSAGVPVEAETKMDDDQMVPAAGITLLLVIPQREERFCLTARIIPDVTLHWKFGVQELKSSPAKLAPDSRECQAALPGALQREQILKSSSASSSSLRLVNQRDKHFPMLTVKETLAFAHKFCGGELSKRGEAMLSKGSPHQNWEHLGLQKYQNAIQPSPISTGVRVSGMGMDDAITRGVSGERKARDDR
ncbi:hypothetical protein PHYPSEUDO_004050 [Phytophthora pseudosyringae]|uniref:Uncharacterized protein n=1 Tax=Phytophthora pseudosyringae TaxID=221518 RepID=A0A8T1VQ47_9STRA|nr:hypothetical protein PHYPSEUDO_004050 [Phytophthora pseudosyringae]